ncbi:F-box/FBD/LRR-repeat protein At1g13570-like [Rutidosis leptorrhynchoides]|uniref:F-box/FBD/LRR-repeat protein At1g13570-like n=1 Tax=Rutidosis leptorrhynchoides TaxID=125765 RepID=UPI003A998888
MNNPSPNNTTNKELSLDRISILPPSIIDAILCLLPTKDAVRTSILSSEWRYNWTNIPVLHFRFDDFHISETGTDVLSILEQTYNLPSAALDMIRERKCIDAIKQCLLLHEGPLIEFSLLAHESESVELDQLISHLSRKHRIQIFNLDMINEYRLPLSFFSMHQLTKLSLRNCCIYHHYSKIKGFSNLKSLYMCDARISTKTLSHLLSSCPLLKSFILFTDEIFDNDKSSICGLNECLPVVERLIIDTGVSQWFSFDLLPQEQLISLVHLKYLHVDHMLFLNNYDLPMLFHLIRSSPNLETLSLHMRDDLDPGSSFEINKYSNIWLKNLSKLKIYGHFDIVYHLQFVQLILAKSPMPKKVRIYTVEYDEVSEILRLLQHSPSAASGSIEIIVEYSRDARCWGSKSLFTSTSYI